MLSKEVCESTYQDIENGGYLDDWVLNCARAMKEQAITAITLQAKLDEIEQWCNADKYGEDEAEDDGIKYAQGRILQIIKGGE